MSVDFFDCECGPGCTEHLNVDNFCELSNFRRQLSKQDDKEYSIISLDCPHIHNYDGQGVRVVNKCLLILDKEREEKE